MTPEHVREKIREALSSDNTSNVLSEIGRSGSIYEQDDLAWALIYATQRGRINIVAGLLKVGANPNRIPDGALAGAMHNAVAIESLEIIDLLLENGADVNLRDLDSGSTPLHHSVDDEGDGALQTRTEPSVRLTEFLLSRGANPALKNRRGQTSIDLAESYRHEKALQIMVRAIQQNRAAHNDA